MSQQERELSLVSMRNGQSGMVMSIIGGRGTLGRLEALGIRMGARITKKSALLGHGPIIVVVGNAEIAVGYQMASRIIVEVER